MKIAKSCMLIALILIPFLISSSFAYAELLDHSNGVKVLNKALTGITYGAIIDLAAFAVLCFGIYVRSETKKK